MKVLYIQSGYGGIYSYFDRWAEECFQNTHTEYMIADKPEAESLMKIEAFQPDFTLMMVGDRVPHDWLTWLKGKDIPVYVWLTEDPFYMDISLQVIKLADAILTIEQMQLSTIKSSATRTSIMFRYQLTIGCLKKWAPNIPIIQIC